MRSSIRNRVARLEARVHTSRATEEDDMKRKETVQAFDDAIRRYCQRDGRCPRVGYCDKHEKCMGTPAEEAWEKEYDRKLAEKKWWENPEERSAEDFTMAAKRMLDRTKAFPDRYPDSKCSALWSRGPGLKLSRQGVRNWRKASQVGGVFGAYAVHASIRSRPWLP
jgi:hypothetical protein